jgi:hypothetical protein
LRLIEEPYHAPPGALDVPYVYVFDASGITDNLAELLNNSLQINNNSAFILRHIQGLNLCVKTAANGGAFGYKNASQSYAHSNPGTGILVNSGNWPVVPEKEYPANSIISFDLFNTLRNFNVCGQTPIYNSQVAFCGVKRYPAEQGRKPQTTPYKWKPFKQTYTYSLLLNYAHFDAGGHPTPAVRYAFQLDNYDFELMRISITVADVNANPPTGSVGCLQTNDFQMRLYDCNLEATSSAPLNQYFINNGKATAKSQPLNQSIHPVPTLLYPAGGQIQFDIVSMLCSGQLPITYQLCFEGIWRLPC